MRAALIAEVGRSPTPADVDEPSSGSGEALIRVSAGALNPVEVRVAAGRMGTLETPYVPGLEGAGTVVQSSRFPAGTRVRFENHLPGYGKDGALREVTVAEEEALVELPDSVDDADAAAIGVTGITARLALLRAGLRDGETLAVLGATGGVGQMVVQAGRLMGASRVVAVGRDRPTLDTLPADAAVALDREGDLAEALAEHGPFDVVVDMLWGEPAMAVLGAMAEEGRLVNVGNAAGLDVDLPLQDMRKVRSAVIGLSSGWARLEDKTAAYRWVLDRVVGGQIEVAREVVPLDQVEEAWSRQADSPHRKLVISLD